MDVLLELTSSAAVVDYPNVFAYFDKHHRATAIELNLQNFKKTLTHTHTRTHHSRCNFIYIFDAIIYTC